MGFEKKNIIIVWLMLKYDILFVNFFFEPIYCHDIPFFVNYLESITIYETIISNNNLKNR